MKVFVSYSHPQGFGFGVVEIIKDMNDIMHIRKLLQEQNRMDDSVILSIQKLPIK